MMTDEQYIDALFTTEPCGYEKTPGFRAFLLDAMAAIGERPRAGDVASMHMAYRAGMESAPNWTTDRPTEPGEYWLGLKPSSRAGILPTTGYPLAVTMFRHDGDPCVGINGVAFGLEARCFDGAKWSRRETPADPFEVTT